MESRFPSRAWSCETLQRALVLSSNIPMDMGALGEMDVRELELELERLQEGVPSKNYVRTWNCGLDAFSTSTYRNENSNQTFLDDLV